LSRFTSFTSFTSFTLLALLAVIALPALLRLNGFTLGGDVVTLTMLPRRSGRCRDVEYSRQQM